MGGLLCYLPIHFHTHMPDAFLSELGQISNKSPPPISSCPLQFTPGARREEAEEDRSWSWPKNNSLWTFSMSQRHKATLSNIYQQAVPDHCAREACLVRKGLWKWFKSFSAAAHRSSLASEWWCGEKEKTLPFFPTCPQFSRVIIWASIESFSVTDVHCNSFTALGSWESICICMISLHNK